MIIELQCLSHLRHGLSMGGSCGQQQSCQHKGVRAARHGAATASYDDLQQQVSMVRTSVCYSKRQVVLLRGMCGPTIGCILLCTGTVSQRQSRCSTRYRGHRYSIQHQSVQNYVQDRSYGSRYAKR